MLVFMEGGKVKDPEKKKPIDSRDEKQQQTKPTCEAKFGNRTQATAVKIECSHYYPIPAPPIIFPQHHPAKSLLLVVYKPYLWNFNSFLEWTFNFFQINLDELFAV